MQMMMLKINSFLAPIKPKYNFRLPHKKLIVKTQPNCKNCIHSFMLAGEPVCSLFKYGTVTMNEISYNYYMYADYCRSNEKLCGQDGFYYEEK